MAVIAAIVALLAAAPGGARAQEWTTVEDPPRAAQPETAPEAEPTPQPEPGSDPPPATQPPAGPQPGPAPDPAAEVPGAPSGVFDLNFAAATAMDWVYIVLVATAPLVLIILWLGDVIRPGSFKRKGKRDVSGFPVLIWLFGMFVVFSAQAFGFRVGEALPGLLRAADQAGLPIETLSEDPLRDQAMMMVTGVLFALIAGGVMMYLLGAKSDKDGLRIRASDIPVGLMAIALSVPLLVVASQGAVWAHERLTGAAPDQIAHETLRTIIDNRHHAATWVIVLAVVIGVPIVEELMFRAFLQSALLRLFGSAWAAILVSSGLFVWLHLVVSEAGDMVVPWHAAPTLFCLSVAMGVAFERTRRIGVPMAMHIAFNAVNVALAMTVVGPAAQGG